MGELHNARRVADGTPNVTGWIGDLPVDGGEMGRLIRDFDWAETALGPTESWSPGLRMMTRFLLANRFPLLLWWGPEYVSIYNDAYRPVLGTKHPWALGRPVREVWEEIWDILRPLIDRPFGGGPATWDEDIALEINRHGFVEETHFTVAYSPVPDESEPSGIGGVLATVHEITESVVGERRLEVLRELGGRATDAGSAEEACALAAETLSQHPRDVPFALVYLAVDKSRCRLAGVAGVRPGDPAAAIEIDFGGPPPTGNWPLAEAARVEASVLVDDLYARFGAGVPPGPFSDPPSRALIIPIPSTLRHEVSGFVVAGMSARLPADQGYVGFLELVAGQIATMIADARSLEDAQRRADALAELDRAKTAFFANVSHEFRTPLTLILGSADQLIAHREAETDALAKENLSVLRRNSLRLLKLVNSLLDFSRIEAGHVDARYEPVDLAEATAEVASLFHEATERARVKLIVDCPPLEEDVYVDREMWEKIVLNLVSNAFKFTLEGEIEVRVERHGDVARLVVRDTGVGIPADEIGRVFDRFHRVETSRGRTFEGTGIGLSLVRELAELHGGTVLVESVPDEGSTFVVTLPFGAGHLAEDLLVAPSGGESSSRADAYIIEALQWVPDQTGQPAPTAIEQRRPRVVIADDNADLRRYVSRLLEGQFEIEAVANGTEALAAARSELPDVLVCDVMMPQLDGIGLVREIRNDADLATMPVIVLSARSSQQSRIEAMEAGADDHLSKPFSSSELVAKVEAHVRLGAARREAHAAERAARERAELLGEIVTALEEVPSSRLRAERLVGFLVPRLVTYASISLAGGTAVEAGNADETIELTLFAGGQVHGTMAVGRAGHSLSAHERSLFREIAERVSLPFANSVVEEREHEIALRLQRALLPAELCHHPNITIAARYAAGSETLEVGGDWYDAFELDDGRIGLAVGDVGGHGLDAAAAMGRLRIALAALASSTASPADVVASLGRFASGANGVDYATACYAVLDPEAGELTYASAGHPPILLVEPQGETTWLTDGQSVPLGLGLESGGREGTCRLGPRTLVVLYSDGLVERRGENLGAGLARLESLAVAYRAEPVDVICEKLVAGLTDGDPASDDIVVLTLRFSPAPMSRANGKP